MTACPERTLSLHALADGELDGIHSAAVEAHLRGCPACAGEFDRIVAVRAVLSNDDLRHGIPVDLYSRIVALVDAEINLMSLNTGVSPSRPIWSWIGGGAVGALAASLALLIATPQVATPGLEDELIASHVRSLLAAHLVDVKTSNRHIVKPWFNGRIDFAPPVVDLATSGFPLVGGRLDYIGGKVIPALVYQHRLHRMNLFIRPAPDSAVLKARFDRRDGYGLMHWRMDGLDYWIVSDVEQVDFETFQTEFVHHSRQ